MFKTLFETILAAVISAALIVGLLIANAVYTDYQDAKNDCGARLNQTCFIVFNPSK